MTAPTTILALVRRTGGFYHGELLSGLAREVGAGGGRLLVVQTMDPGTDTDDYLGELSFDSAVGWADTDGIVVVAQAVSESYVRRLPTTGKPVVLASHQVAGLSLPSVLPDNRGGIRAAVDHLVAHGHTRLGFIGSTDQHDYRERYAAFREAVRLHGLDDDDALFYEATNFAESGGEAAARQLLARDTRPSAVVTACDPNALGAIRALTAAGLTVPHDIAVIGFDNTEAAAYGTPSLSTVNQRFEEIGALAGKLVLAAVHGAPVPPIAHTPRAAGVVTRESCGCRSELVDGSRPLTRHAPSAADSRRHELEATLSAVLGDTQAQRDGVISAAIDDVERLVIRSGVIEEREVRSLTARLQALTPDRETMHRVASALRQHVVTTVDAAADTHDAATPIGATLVEAALLELQLRGVISRARRLDDVVLEHHDVAGALIAAQGGAPERLEWLKRSTVRSAVLGLWTAGTGDGGLRLAGVHDPLGSTMLQDELDTVVPVGSFPPVELLDHLDARTGEVCLVVCVRTAARDWGLLAAPTRIDVDSSRETFLHWSSLLCAALEVRELQASARASEERLARVAAASHDGLWELDLRTSALDLSERCREIVDAPSDERLTSAFWFSTVHPEDRARVEEGVERAAAQKDDDAVELEYRVIRPEGSHRWVLSRAIGVQDDSGHVSRVLGSLADVTPRKELEEQLRHGALFDAVTGLPNRRLFLDRLRSAVEQRRRQPSVGYAVVFLDLDGFKLVNDSLGHLAGDQLLAVVGTRLGHELRAVDTAARFGGDEFAVLLFDPAPDQVLAVVRRIQQRIAEPVVVAGQEVVVTASVGVAFSAAGYVDAEEVLRDADIAMYDAKARRRGSASVFEGAMHARATHRLRTRTEIRSALADRQFVVHYQPILPTVGGVVTRFEALVRWQHPERGVLLPGEFLPAMAGDETAVALGAWVVDEVCRQIADWRRDVPHEVAVSVNLSHEEFWSDGLIPTLREALSRHGVDPRALVVEITETVVMSDLDRALTVMDGLRALGLSLHMDDFGTGHSSLSALRLCPVDTVKIDGSFVRALGQDPQAALLVGTIVQMADALGLEVVAECVETPAQAATLAELGCEVAQGWLYAAALPPASATSLLGAHLGTVPAATPPARDRRRWSAVALAAPDGTGTVPSAADLHRARPGARR